LGGQILAAWSWQGIFWILVGFGLLTFAGVLTLPETLPASRRNMQRLRETFFGYPQLLRNRRMVGYALAGGFFFSGLLAQVAGTPFAYIDFYHVPPKAYGLLFGVNIVGMMGANFLNARLVMRLGADRIFRFGTGMAAVAGVAVALQTRYGWGGLPGLLVPMFFYVSTFGFIVANSVAGALALFTHKAGAASGLVGAIHFSAGMLSAALVGWFADGTPWTMGWVIGVSGIGSFVTAMLLQRSSPAGSPLRNKKCPMMH
jgi:DHA1 family bicyclomycin/chloramphenicol resistance-like MFS transporter